MSANWQRFMQAARLEEPDQIPVALIVDSPWLPGYAGMNTLDFFLDHDKCVICKILVVYCIYHSPSIFTLNKNYLIDVYEDYLAFVLEL